VHVSNVVFLELKKTEDKAVGNDTNARLADTDFNIKSEKGFYNKNYGVSTRMASKHSKNLEKNITILRGGYETNLMSKLSPLPTISSRNQQSLLLTPLSGGDHTVSVSLDHGT